MADGGQDFNLGHVVGADGAKGDDGSTVWNTSTAPTYANSKYTFTISNLSGKTGLQIAVNDIIFYSTYYYIVSTVNSTTVDCATRVNIKGSDASVTIVDNLTSTSSTSALSAKQGKVLNDNKIETSAIATSFGSTLSDSKVPSEKLTKNSLDAKADASSLATVATTGDYDDLTDKPTIPTKTSDLTNDGADGTNVFVANNDSRLTDSRTPTSHSHGQITDAGAITSTAVTVASGDNIVITDYSDSSKVKRVANLLASHIKDSNAHSNIGSSASATQATINTNIDTALGNKVSTSSTTGLLKNDGTVMTSGTGSSNYAAGNHTHSGYVSATKVNSWQSTPSDSNVPSEKLVKDSLDDIEDLIGDAIAYINQ